MLDMASPAVGARIEHLHFGLRRFLQPHVGDKEDGSCFFRDAHQRQIMRVRGPLAVCPNPLPLPPKAPKAANPTPCSRRSCNGRTP